MDKEISLKYYKTLMVVANMNLQTNSYLFTQDQFWSSILGTEWVAEDTRINKACSLKSNKQICEREKYDVGGSMMVVKYDKI